MSFNLPATQHAIAARIEEIVATAKSTRAREGWVVIASSDRRAVLIECARCVRETFNVELQSPREWAKAAFAAFRAANPQFERASDDSIDNRLSEINSTISSMCFTPESFTCYF